MNDTAKPGALRPKFKRNRGLSRNMRNEVCYLAQHRMFVEMYGKDGKAVEEATILAVDAALCLLGYSTDLTDEIRRMLGLRFTDGE